MLESNPLMLFKVKIPGKVFQLPSKGIFYNQGILADTVTNGEIQVKPMSALTEMKIRSADLLISGKVLEEVCLECVPDVLKPSQLVVKDVDAIFCFLVVATYGDTKTVNASHGCEKSEYHDYQINLGAIVADPRNKILEHRDALFRKELSTGHVINIKQVTFADSLVLTTQRQEIMQLEVEKKPVERAKLERLVVDDLLAVIASVEVTDHDNRTIKVTDRKLIEVWVRSLTRKQTEEIVSAGNATVDWGFNFTVKLTCKDCEQPFDYDLELNPVNFFSG